MKLLVVGHNSKAFIEEIIKKLENRSEEGIVLIHEVQPHIEVTDNYVDSIIKKIEKSPDNYCDNIVEKIEDDYDTIIGESLIKETNSISYPFNKHIHKQNVKVKSKFNYQNVKRFYNTKIK